MPLLNFTAIMGRAALVRHKAGYLDGADPPYSTRRIIAAAFPNVDVAGADLPKGVLEMAEVHGTKRILWYNRQASHPAQRVGLAHGLHHFLTDLKEGRGMRECNVPLRQLEREGFVRTDPDERGADLFGGELLTPFDVLDRFAPLELFPRDERLRELWHDQVDQLASTFNVPAGFIRWRLYDLALLRKTHFFTR